MHWQARRKLWLKFLPTKFPCHSMTLSQNLELVLPLWRDRLNSLLMHAPLHEALVSVLVSNKFASCKYVVHMRFRHRRLVVDLD